MAGASLFDKIITDPVGEEVGVCVGECVLGAGKALMWGSDWSAKRQPGQHSWNGASRSWGCVRFLCAVRNGVRVSYTNFSFF